MSVLHLKKDWREVKADTPATFNKGPLKLQQFFAMLLLKNFLCFSLIFGYASAASKKTCLTPNLSEAIIQQYPELIFVDRRFDFCWHDKEGLSLVLGSLLAPYVKLSVEVGGSMIEGKQLLRALNSICKDSWERFQRHSTKYPTCMIPIVKERIQLLDEFIQSSFDMTFLNVKLSQILYCSRVHEILFNSDSPYASIVLSVAVLKSLNGMEEREELLADMSILLHSMFALLHLPKIRHFVQADLAHIVTVFLDSSERHLDWVIIWSRKIFSLLRTLPKDEPIIQIFLKRCGKFLLKDFLFLSFLPDFDQTVSAAFRELVEQPPMHDPAITRARAYFLPILLLSGPLYTGSQTGCSFYYGHLCKVKRHAGKSISPFSRSVYNEITNITFLAPAEVASELLEREEVVYFFHELPVSEEFKEQVRRWVDGDSEADPLFLFTLYAAGVSIFTSRASIF